MIGYHVYCRSNWVLVQPDVSSVSKAVGTFLVNVGVKSAEATVVPIGATSGGPGLIEGIDPVAKLLGHVVTVVKLVLAWRARVTTLARKRLRPLVTMTLLADHVPLHRETADTYCDTASLIVSFLPELLRELQESHPSFNISIRVRARGVKAEKVDIQVGNGLDLTDQHVMKILKWLKGDTSSMTVRHTENWLSFPSVRQIKGRAFTARQFSGRAMMGGV
ncbi:hypothetical protein [Pseudarthrobacter sp. MDT3-1]